MRSRRITLLSFQRPRPVRATHEKGLRSWRPRERSDTRTYQAPVEGLSNCLEGTGFVRSRFRQPTHDSNDPRSVKRRESARIDASRPGGGLLRERVAARLAR